MNLLDPSHQPLVVDPTRGPGAGGAVVLDGRRHAQDPADRLDAETAAMPIDEAAHFGRSASSSVANNTLAAFKISFALRNLLALLARRQIRSQALIGLDLMDVLAQRL